MIAATPAILRTTAEAIAATLSEVAALPPRTPTNDRAALDGTDDQRIEYGKLRQLATRYVRLRTLAIALVTPLAAPLFAVWLDTRLAPTADNVSAGPPESNPLVRLRWVATPEAKSWTPSAGALRARFDEPQAERARLSAGQVVSAQPPVMVPGGPRPPAREVG